MSSDEWDARYADHQDGLWSGRPNGVLVQEMTGFPPGRALDVGCGEGADAIWLARAGWEVTGLDVAQVALDRAAEASQAAGVAVEWMHADVADVAQAYDLVSLHYPAIKHSADDEAIRALLRAVAAAGTLLVVGHAPLDPAFALAHGFRFEDYVQPADIWASLDRGWEIEIGETRPRVDPVPEGSPFTHDAVLRARRRE